jgi:glycosyltransferase involved in cell wall biosynthesis
MVIGFDAKRVFNNRTGLGNYSRMLLTDLYHCAPTHTHFNLFTPKISIEHNFLINEPRVKRIMPQRAFRHFGGLWRSYQVAKESAQHKVEVFHGLSNELPQGLESLKIPSVVTIHDLIFLERPELYPRTDRIIYRHKFEQACKQAQKVLATSIATKQDIMKHFGIPSHKIEVVYQDCDPGYAQAFSDLEKLQVLKQFRIQTPFILSVGTIEKRKNHLNLLKAYQQLGAKDIALVLVGRRAEGAPALDAFIRQYQLENQVHIIEGISLHQLQVLYHCAHIFAYISEIEGFGIPVLEALKAGIPTICSNISSMPEVAGEAALKVNPYEVGQIQSALSELVQTETTRNALKAMMPEQVKKFDGKKIAQQVLSIYQSL